MYSFQFTRSTLGSGLLKWGQLFLEEILWRGGKFSGSSFPWGQFPSGEIVRQGIIYGAIIQGAIALEP